MQPVLLTGVRFAMIALGLAMALFVTPTLFFLERVRRPIDVRGVPYIAILVGCLFMTLRDVHGQLDDKRSEIPLELEFPKNVRSILNEFCYRCHGPEKQESGLRIDMINGSLEDKQLFLLKHVLDQLKSESMPPDDERQPSASQRMAVVEWVERALQLGEKMVRAKNGGARRLTVAQYHNTLRDLLGVEDHLADALPADGISDEGFRNNEDTLLLTPQMMETYFEIADQALDLCLVDETSKPQIQCFRVELGLGVDKAPTDDHVQLNGPRVLPQQDYLVREIVPDKPFPFEPLEMQKKFRFVEGYRGNATVRDWRDFKGLHHSVFAAIIGRHTGGYNYGRSWHFVPEGLLLRPRTPETDTKRGPAPTFSMPMRELPISGMLQVTVEAARYEDGLQPHTPAPKSEKTLELDISEGKEATFTIPKAGVYHFDVVWDGAPGDDVVTADIGKRVFSKRIKAALPPSPDNDGKIVIPFLLARCAEGATQFKIGCGDGRNLRQVWITPVAEGSDAGRQFAEFEQRVPYVSVHMGLRTDVGARLARFDGPKPVTSSTIQRYSFRAPISSFAAPDTEESNENYLAGLREIAIRSEPTDSRQIPRVLVRAVEIEGPYYESWPPKGHRNVFIASQNKDKPELYAREVLENFSTLAFRRPPIENEIGSLLQVWRESYNRTSDFQLSIRHALLVVLTSPQFLFLTEESSSPAPEPLSSYELAAKLSYFLWNTTPDAKLLSLAQNEELREDLSSEVTRMIGDERFQQFTNEFVAQWLSLDKFDVVKINRSKLPRLIREVKRELRKEPIHFVTHLLRNNLPVRNLVDSDFIVANEVVAGYYGIGNRVHRGYRFVPVRHESETLGGVLTQAAILSGLSDGSESNPIKRGAWLARKIVADPPEPPPPNVPELPSETKGATLRERLEQHRNQKGCANCHQKIDPWGLPFEQYDAGGLFKKQQVDASIILPDQTVISDAKSLKRYLAEDRIDQVAYSFLMHLASYATGRKLTFNEREYLKTEGRKQLKSAGYLMKDCVVFVIESPIFLEK